MDLGIAIWGAIVATVLAVREIVVWRRDRALLNVEASVVSTSVPSDPGERDPRLVVVPDHRGLDRSLFLAVSVANRGHRAIQITCVLFLSDKYEQQVSARGLPAVLEPTTRLDLVLQLEWIATHGANLVGCGVRDALGRMHHVEARVLKSLVDAVAAVPTRLGSEGTQERRVQTRFLTRMCLPFTHLIRSLSSDCLPKVEDRLSSHRRGDRRIRGNPCLPLGDLGGEAANPAPATVAYSPKWVINAPIAVQPSRDKGKTLSLTGSPRLPMGTPSQRRYAV